MHLTNNNYFAYGKNLKTPNLSPMLRSRWRRFWDLWSIYVVSLLFLVIQVALVEWGKVGVTQGLGKDFKIAHLFEQQCPSKIV